MSNYRRLRTKGAMYFFTVVSFERRPIFCEPNFLTAFRKSIIEVRKAHPFDIVGWVQLPDHLHCIWQLPQNDDEYSLRWAKIKLYTSKKVPELYLSSSKMSESKQKRNETGIWQRRFYEHQIRNEQDFINHMNYLHYNPVKHGLVNSAYEWKQSSFHRLVKENLYPVDWGSEIPMFPNGFLERVE